MFFLSTTKTANVFANVERWSMDCMASYFSFLFVMRYKAIDNCRRFGITTYNEYWKGALS